MQQSYYFAQAEQEFQDRNRWYKLNFTTFRISHMYNSEMILILKIKLYKQTCEYIIQNDISNIIQATIHASYVSSDIPEKNTSSQVK